MSGTDKVAYPHALRFPVDGANYEDIVHFTDVQAAFNYQVLGENTGSGPFACFIGATSQAPTITATTRQLAEVIDLCNPTIEEGEYWCSRGFPGPLGVDLYYASGKPRGWREGAAATVHQRCRMGGLGDPADTNVMMFWQNINATQGTPVELEFVVMSGINDNGDVPMFWAGAQALTGDASCQNTYMLGPIRVNGVKLEDNLDLTWNNNIIPLPVASAGQTAPSYLGINRARPMFMFTTHNIDQIVGAQIGGSAAVAVEVYFRRRSREGFLFPDDQAEHIQISSLATFRISDNVTQLEPSRTTVAFHIEQPIAGQPPFAIDTTSIIPE